MKIQQLRGSLKYELHPQKHHEERDGLHHESDSTNTITYNNHTDSGT